MLDLLLPKALYIYEINSEYFVIPSFGAIDIPARVCWREFARDLHKQRMVSQWTFR
jgi:hypothetical protein